MEGWGGISLSGVAATGDLKQLYPTWAVAGDAPPHAYGETIRNPGAGRFGSVQIQTDNVNGGTIELWDLNGADASADVSSLDVVTNAQLVALQALGKAKLIWSQNFTSSAGAVTPGLLANGFMRGLAARYVQTNPGATCKINLTVEGGFYFTKSAG